MASELQRVFEYSADFYLKKILLIALFSVPFFVAFLVPLLVPAPTYLAAGGLLVRTGSLPEFSVIDVILVSVAYFFAMFIISDTIVNINIIVRSKRTLNETTQEMFSAMQTHAMKIFYILTFVLLLNFIVQLLIAYFDIPFGALLYPLFSFVVSFLLFYIAPAVVIDNSSIDEAIARSMRLAVRKPEMIIAWLLVGSVLLIVSKVFGDFIFPGLFSQYFVMLINAILLLPFLIVLQTQMYMEKYPLAR
ncbi:MAG: hypothetical protein V1492_03175 [Candidatus Micrarchaeota archaeon]